MFPKKINLLSFNKEEFNFNILIYFIFIAILYILISLYTNHFILTISLYHNSFDSQLSYSRINELFSNRYRWEWVALAVLPLILLIRISFTSACLAIGCFLQDFRLSFKNIFRISLVAEICLAVGMIVRITWLTFTPATTLTDIQYFSPLSLAQLLGPKSIPKYLLYLCQTINVFEIAYWVVLAFGLVAFLQKPFSKMFKLVISSYGVGLLLWIIFVSYLTVTFSP